MNTEEFVNDEMAEQQQREVFRRLFGGIRKLDASGGHQPTLKQLQKLGKVEHAADYGVVNSFCAGCGTILCLIQEGSQALAQIAGVPVPPNWEGKYFQVLRCPACNDEFKNPELKQLG